MDKRHAVLRSPALRPAALVALVALTTVAAARLLGASDNVPLLSALSAADQGYVVAAVFLAHSLAIGAVAEDRTAGYVLGACLGIGWLAVVAADLWPSADPFPALDVAVVVSALPLALSTGASAAGRLLPATRLPANVTDLDEWRSRAALRHRQSSRANR